MHENRRNRVITNTLRYVYTFIALSLEHHSSEGIKRNDLERGTRRFLFLR